VPEGRCPTCGFWIGDEPDPSALTHGTGLGDQYVVGKVLGAGGFGITYLGWDVHLERRVAIKEYFPREFAARARDTRSVRVRTQNHGEWYAWGMDRFLSEARMLAKVKHENIVEVQRFFQANGTAYLVMPYFDGISLEELLVERHGRLTERASLDMLFPIVSG
jgi:serine/threonine protein kinase